MRKIGQRIFKNTSEVKLPRISLAGNTKAATILIEQIFVLLFGVLLLVMIITVFTSLRTKSFDYVATSQFGSIANYVHNGVIIAGEDMQVSDTGKIFLDLPDKVGDKSYQIEIRNNVINVTDTEGVLSAAVTIFNLNSTISGNVSSGGGGKIFINYNRSANSIMLSAEERVIST